MNLPFSILGNESLEAVKAFVSDLNHWQTLLKDPETNKVLSQFYTLLQSEGVIQVPLDETISLNVLRRQILRRCPFHRAKSTSFGDAALIETILNLDVVTGIELRPGDIVVFVSKNSDDFSLPGKPDILHPDISEDAETRMPRGVSLEYGRRLFAALKTKFDVNVPEQVVEDEAYETERPAIPSRSPSYLDLFSGSGVMGNLDRLLVTIAAANNALRSTPLPPELKVNLKTHLDNINIWAGSTGLRGVAEELSRLPRHDIGELSKLSRLDLAEDPRRLGDFSLSAELKGLQEGLEAIQRLNLGEQQGP